MMQIADLTKFYEDQVSANYEQEQLIENMKEQYYHMPWRGKILRTT